MKSIFVFTFLLGISTGVKAGPSNMILASETGVSKMEDPVDDPYDLSSLKANDTVEFPNLFAFYKSQNPNDAEGTYVVKTTTASRCDISLVGSKNRTTDSVALTKARKWKANPGLAPTIFGGFTMTLSSEEAPNDTISITCNKHREGRHLGQLLKDLKIKITRSFTVERISADSVDPNLLIQPAVLEKKEVLDGHWGEKAPPRPRPGQKTGTR